MDVVFLIDASKKSIFNDMKDFVKSFSHKFVLAPSATRVAMVTYGSDASILFGFTRYCCRKQLDEALDKLEYPSFVARRFKIELRGKHHKARKWSLKHARGNNTHAEYSNVAANESGKFVVRPFIWST